MSGYCNASRMSVAIDQLLIVLMSRILRRTRSDGIINDQKNTLPKSHISELWHEKIFVFVVSLRKILTISIRTGLNKPFIELLKPVKSIMHLNFVKPKHAYQLRKNGICRCTSICQNSNKHTSYKKINSSLTLKWL